MSTFYPEIWNGKFDEILSKGIDNLAGFAHDIGINNECGSEIEKMLGLVFFMHERVPHYNGLWFEYFTQFWSHPSKLVFDDLQYFDQKPNTINVFAQVPVDNYRADFICVMKMQSRDLPPKLQYLGIECDGHDFHEKTKEQAARDKSRDRSFLLRGIPCMRFAGSEIWKDAYACATQVDEFFRKSFADYVNIEYEAGAL